MNPSCRDMYYLGGPRPHCQIGVEALSSTTAPFVTFLNRYGHFIGFVVLLLIFILVLRRTPKLTNLLAQS